MEKVVISDLRENIRFLPKEINLRKNTISITTLIDVVSLYLHPARPLPLLLRVELCLKPP